MIPRPDLLPRDAREGIEVFQITTEDVPSSHIYMEAQIFTPDSRRFLLHRSAEAHRSDPTDPEHRYLVCDVESGALTRITDELAAKAPAISPDGRTVYYFVDETRPGGGRLLLKRIGLDGTGRDTIMAVEGRLGDTRYTFSHGYPISTISPDGKRLVYSGFLGDGTPETATWGFLTFDIEQATVQVHALGEDWCNLHPQYSRSLDPRRARDVLIQHNHGSGVSPEGEITRWLDPLGADIHVIRDDGTDFRDMPWGRDGNERCQGHQCWIGRTERAITSTITADVAENQIIEGLEAPESGHIGARIVGACRNDLTRGFPVPHFYHFATDIAGSRFITDYKTHDDIGIYVADLPGEPGGAMSGFERVVSPGGTWEKSAHTHPFLSPDGRVGFFNSNESGRLQAYLVRGF